MEALASTPAARRNLIARYFEPTEDEVDEGQKTPSPAHRAIAELVRRGSVRAILTTNFDRLAERALEDAGVAPQVIRTPADIPGMTPLAHAPATVIKLHGDYADLLMRNTVDELDSYPAEWDALLDRVLEEYGLIVSGWSADWDKALVAAHRRVRSRRYPLFWDSRSSKGEAAKDILSLHRGVVVPSADADTMFRGLVDRVDALDRLAEPPLTSALAIQRLKCDLLDPTRRIAVHDLVAKEVDRVVAHVATIPTYDANLTNDGYVEWVLATFRESLPLARLVAVGVQHDCDGLHDDLWVRTLQRLMRLTKRASGQYQPSMVNLGLLPAAVMLRAAGFAAIQTKRDGLFLRLCAEPRQPNPYKQGEFLPAGYVLSDYDVLHADGIKKIGQTGNSHWRYPPSHLIREQMADAFPELLHGEEDYGRAQNEFEYKLALYQFLYPNGGPTPGEFLIGFDGWGMGDFALLSEFQDVAKASPDDWPWWSILGKRDEFDETMGTFYEQLRQIRQR